MNVHAILQRVLPPVERIGTGLLRLAAVAEARDERERAENRPRDMCGYWVRPSQVDTVRLGYAQHTGYQRDCVKITMRSGQEYVVWRSHDGGTMQWTYEETHEETMARVLRALGWEA